MATKAFTPDFPMPIATPRLLIRPPKPDDLAAVNATILASYEVVQPFMNWAQEKPTLEDTDTFITESIANWILKKKDEPWLPLFLFDKITGRFAGATGYHHYNWDVPCIESGYWISQACTGKGLMTEAINALTQYAFMQLKVVRMAITCDIDNIRSKKIPERLHYKLEAVLKSNRRKPLTNELSDTLVFARYNLDNLPPLPVTWGHHCEP